MIEPLDPVRVEKLKSIEALGFNPYPTEYRYTQTIAKSSRNFPRNPPRNLSTTRSRSAWQAGSSPAVRFGKAGFLALSDGGARLQVYAKKDQLPERDFQLYQLLDIGDFIGVEGTLFRTRTGELTVLAKEITFLVEEFSSPAGEVARPDGCRNPLPATICGSCRESRSPRRFREAQPDHPRVAALSRRSRLFRSGDADPASDRRRRAREAVQDASQRARHARCT